MDEVSTEMDLHQNILGRSGANVDGQIEAIADIILDRESAGPNAHQSRKCQSDLEEKVGGYTFANAGHQSCRWSE